jgi:glycosyltransferase involved in cell wall biosynthesis
MPKVSIIVPVFNCAPYIEDCLASLTTQTETDIEMIVVDDGSRDGSLEIVARLAAKDIRISILSFPSNSGFPGFARNQGIARASGQYIAFLDGDDLYHPRKIESVVSAFERLPDVNVVFHDVVRFWGTPGPDTNTSFLTNARFIERAAEHLTKGSHGLYRCNGSLYRFASLHFVPCHTSSIVVRRDALLSERIWFPEVKSGEDGDLWFRLLKNQPFAFINEALSYYRQRPGSITSDQAQYLLGSIQVHKDNLKRGEGIFSKRDESLYQSKIADFLFNLGYQQFRALKTREAREAYGEALRLDFRIPYIIGYLKTFVSPAVVAQYRRFVEASNAD